MPIRPTARAPRVSQGRCGCRRRARVSHQERTPPAFAFGSLARPQSGLACQGSALPLLSPAGSKALGELPLTEPDAGGTAGDDRSRSAASRSPPEPSPGIHWGRRLRRARIMRPVSEGAENFYCVDGWSGRHLTQELARSTRWATERILIQNVRQASVENPRPRNDRSPAAGCDGASNGRCQKHLVVEATAAHDGVDIPADQTNVPELPVFHLRQQADGAAVGAEVFDAVGELGEHGGGLLSGLM